MFFILSTRMMPPIAVAVPIYMMYRYLNLYDTRIGMILLYTAVNVSLAVWLLKGFIDEIPREYEEAALIDGYTRLQAFRKVVLPQAVTGIAATAIFCLIFSWNEYAFDLLLSNAQAQTMPPFIPFIIGEGGQNWPAVAAGTTLFLRADRDLHHRAEEASAARHHVRSGAQMTDTSIATRRGWTRWFRRGPWENVAMVADRPRHRDADAAVLARSLFLFVRHDPGRHGRVRDRQPLSAIGRASWRKSASRDCTRPFTTLSRFRIRTSSIDDRSFFVMLGPSGCGKTTTLRMIAGLELPTDGRILLDGEDVTFKRAAERDIAFVFQLFALYPHMNVARQHRLSAEVRGRGARRDSPPGRRRRRGCCASRRCSTARCPSFPAATASASRSGARSSAVRRRS